MANDRYFIRERPGAKVYGPWTVEQLRDGVNARAWKADAQVTPAEGQSRNQLDNVSHWQPVGSLVTEIGTRLDGKLSAPEEGPVRRTADADVTSDHGDGPPALTSMFYMLGVLEILGGFMLGMVFWPARPPRGYEFTAAAYTMPLAWIVSGAIFGLLFFALGSGLNALSHIQRDLRRLVQRGADVPSRLEIESNSSERAL